MSQFTKLQKPTKRYATLRFIFFSFNCNLSHFGFNKLVQMAIAKAICTWGGFSEDNDSSTILVKKRLFFCEFINLHNNSLLFYPFSRLLLLMEKLLSLFLVVYPCRMSEIKQTLLWNLKFPARNVDYLITLEEDLDLVFINLRINL